MTTNEILLFAAALHQVQHGSTPAEALAAVRVIVERTYELDPTLLVKRAKRGPYIADELFAARVYAHLATLDVFPSTNMILKAVSGTKRRIRGGIELLIKTGRAKRVGEGNHQGIRLTPHPLPGVDE